MCGIKSSQFEVHPFRLTGMLLVLWLAAIVPIEAHQEVGDAWNWRLPPRRFGRLSQVERARLTRAENLFGQGNYEAAAVEIEQFEAEFPNSELRSHALLLRGYSLHRARSRHTAIDVYTELLDLYAHEIDEAAPAMFLMGNAHIQNGDIERGIAVLTELADRQEYREHPIVDVAMNQVADHFAERDDYQRAENYWRRVLDIYAEAFMRPEDAVKEARRRLADLYIRTRRYDAIDNTLVRGQTDPAKRRETALFLFDRAWSLRGRLDTAAGGDFVRWLRRQVDYFDTPPQKRDFLEKTLRFAVQVEDGDAFGALRSDFADIGNLGSYLEQALGFYRQIGDARSIQRILADLFDYLELLPENQYETIMPRVAARLSELTTAELIYRDTWPRYREILLREDEDRSPLEYARLYRRVLAQMNEGIAHQEGRVLWDTLVARATTIYRDAPSKERNQGIAALVDIASDAGLYDRALDLTDGMDDRPLAIWKKVEVFQKRQDWASAAEACEELEQMDNTELALRAMRTRALLYKDRLSRYQEAILLYNQINDPPTTTWAIVDGYIRWQRPEEADRVLTELENFFEDQAPRAAWRRVRMWEQFENRERMVAAARAVLRNYPDHRVSSEAHQLLNRYGIGLVGGGLMEAED